MSTRAEMDRAWEAENINGPTLEDVALASAIRGLLRATFERGFLAGKRLTSDEEADMLKDHPTRGTP